MKIDTTKYKTKKELFDFLMANKQFIIDQKKAEIKKGDVFSIQTYEKISEISEKAEKNIDENANEIQVTIIVNSTNLLDSHDDVHIPGIWNKTLNERQGRFYFLQEHQNDFDHLIAKGSDLQVFTKNYKWSDLGFAYAGETEALVFQAKVKKNINPKMFDMYKNGYITEHSVGMQYVKLELAINDNDYGKEYQTWEKYYNKKANKEKALELGYFWAVLEAKLYEGSAVLSGSNFATPTLEITTPSNDTGDNEKSEVSNTKKGAKFIRNLLLNS